MWTLLYTIVATLGGIIAFVSWRFRGMGKRRKYKQTILWRYLTEFVPIFWLAPATCFSMEELADKNVSLYTATVDGIWLVRTPDGMNIYNGREHPFIYQSQMKYATEIYYVPWS